MSENQPTIYSDMVQFYLNDFGMKFIFKENTGTNKPDDAPVRVAVFLPAQVLDGLIQTMMQVRAEHASKRQAQQQQPN